MGEKAERQAALEKAAQVESKQIYKGYVFTLRCDTFKIEGAQKTWDIIVHPGAVVIIPIDQKGNIILVEQWRRAAEKIIIELPAGTLEKGEEIANCAQRELQEETGFFAQTLTSFGGIYSAPGFCTEYLHFFLAQDLIPSSLPSDDGEGIDLLYVPLEKALAMIDSGKIIDAKTVAGILRYQRFLSHKERKK